MQMAYVIDTYNKYNKFDKENSCYIFTINEKKYAIKKINSIEDLPQPIGQEVNIKVYQIYQNYDDALQYVTNMRHLN